MGQLKNPPCKKSNLQSEQPHRPITSLNGSEWEQNSGKKCIFLIPRPPPPPDNAGTIGISWDLTEGRLSVGPTPRCPRGGAGCLQLSPLLLLYAPTQKDNCTPPFDPIGDAKRDFCACNYLFSEIIAGTQNCLSPSILPAIISRLEIIAGKTFWNVFPDISHCTSLICSEWVQKNNKNCIFYVVFVHCTSLICSEWVQKNNKNAFFYVVFVHCTSLICS